MINIESIKGKIRSLAEKKNSINMLCYNICISIIGYNLINPCTI